MSFTDQYNDPTLRNLYSSLYGAKKDPTVGQYSKFLDNWKKVSGSYGGNAESILGMLQNDDITIEDLRKEFGVDPKDIIPDGAKTNKFSAWWSKNKPIKGTTASGATQFKMGNATWDKMGGLKYTNPTSGKVTNINRYANVANAAIQGINALSGLGDLGSLKEDTDSLENDIIRSAMSNPLVYSYLTSDQEALLNSIRNGTYSEDADSGDFFDGLFGGLGDAVMPTIMGAATGGIPGALIGGIGSLVNSGIGGMQQGQTEANSQLQGLYSALNQAEQQYRAMRRPNTTGLGLRQSALDQMY